MNPGGLTPKALQSNSSLRPEEAAFQTRSEGRAGLAVAFPRNAGSSIFTRGTSMYERPSQKAAGSVEEADGWSSVKVAREAERVLTEPQGQGAEL